MAPPWSGKGGMGHLENVLFDLVCKFLSQQDTSSVAVVEEVCSRWHDRGSVTE